MPKKIREAPVSHASKDEIAGMFEDLAVMLEILGANPFRCRAYSNAARVLDNLTGDLREMIDNKELLKVKGIGKKLMQKLEPYVTVQGKTTIKAPPKKKKKGRKRSKH